jgi:hypothetical protein
MNPKPLFSLIVDTASNIVSSVFSVSPGEEPEAIDIVPDNEPTLGAFVKDFVGIQEPIQIEKVVFDPSELSEFDLFTPRGTSIEYDIHEALEYDITAPQPVIKEEEEPNISYLINDSIIMQVNGCNKDDSVSSSNGTRG